MGLISNPPLDNVSFLIVAFPQTSHHHRIVFIMPWTVANFIALTVTLLVLAIISVALRFWARTKSSARFGPDDALIVPAVVGDPICSLGSFQLRFCFIALRDWHGRHHDYR
jgi:hypothetical protein